MIIGISGRMQNGKDLVGKIIQILTNFPKMDNEKIIKDLDKEYYNNKFIIKKFADTLKDMVCLLIGCTREQLEDSEFKNKELGKEWWYYKHESEGLLNYNSNKGAEFSDNYTLIKLTPRLMLQLLGTEAGREIIHPNIWVNALFSKYKPISNISKSNIFEDNRVQHGYKNTKIWRTYHNIKQRCSNPKHPRYNDYGGRGITMCEEWNNSITSFIDWAIEQGYNDSLTIDREDNDKGYSPENCRCVSYSTQAINTKIRKDNTSGYKGVSIEKNNNNRIRANIQIKGKIKFLGYFDSLEEASEAYELAFLERENLYVEEEKSNLIYPSWILTDMRFPNELEAVENKAGLTIRINRPTEKRFPKLWNDFQNQSEHDEWDNYLLSIGKLEEVYSTHLSETSLDDADFHYVIENDSDINSLIDKIRIILEKEKII